MLWVPAAGATTPDAASTHRFVTAAARALHATIADRRQERAAADALIERVASVCPHALPSPHRVGPPAEAKTVSWFLAAAGDELILAELRPLRRPYESFDRAISHLRWSSQRLSRQVAAVRRQVRGVYALRPVDLCQEASIGRRSSFTRTPPRILSFVRRFAALTSDAIPTIDEMAGRMKRFADPGDLAAIDRVHSLQRRTDAFFSPLTVSGQDRLVRALVG
jgi:hypothetical protein